MTDMQQRVVCEDSRASANRAASAAKAGALLTLLQPPSGSRPPSLTGAIEADIIPRLVLAQRSAPRHAPTHHAYATTQWGHFTALVLRHDDDCAERHVQMLLTDGAAVDSIFTELFTATARDLGDLWLDDRASFADVTLGVARLTRMMREMGDAFHEGQPRRRGATRSILLLPLAGEQHTFGLLMVADFFRRARWNVTLQSPSFRMDEIAATVAADAFDVVGLSLCHENRAAEMANLIRVVRASSCNRNVGIIVGGFPFVDHPEYLGQVGGDIIATDARTAPGQADALVELRGRHAQR